MGRVALLGGVALSLSACLTPDLQGMVAREWSEEMRELQINPVFPAREDLQVGDIYLPATTPEDAEERIKEKGYLPIGTWLDSLDLRADLLAFYSGRSSYPKTPTGTDAFDGKPGTSAVQPVLTCDTADLPEMEAGSPVTLTASDALKAANPPGNVQTTGGLCNIFTSPQARSVDRMRLVAFPDFAKATITEGELSALIPVEAFTAALGANFSKTRSVVLSVPVAESVGLPAARFMAKAGNKVSDPGVCAAAALSIPAEQMESFKGPEKTFYATVISEVYTARAIDLSIEFEGGGGIAADVSLKNPVGSGDGDDVIEEASSNAVPIPKVVEEPETPADSENSPGTNDDDDSKPDQVVKPSVETPAEPTVASVQRQITSYNEKLAGSIQRSGVGGGLQVMSASAGRIGMRRTFEYPLAIGYRGVTLAIKVTEKEGKPSCTVASGSSTNTAISKILN